MGVFRGRLLDGFAHHRLVDVDDELLDWLERLVVDKLVDVLLLDDD